MQDREGILNFFINCYKNNCYMISSFALNEFTRNMNNIANRAFEKKAKLGWVATQVLAYQFVHINCLLY